MIQMCFMMLSENLDFTRFLVSLLHKWILKLDTGVHIEVGLKKLIYIHLTGCKHWLKAHKHFGGFADSL